MANETLDGLTIFVSVKGKVRGSDGAYKVVNFEKTYRFADGTGEDQIGAVWEDEVRALNNTNETLDLDALSDFKGATMSDNNRVKVALVENLSETAAQTLTIGGGDWVGPFVDASDKLVVGPRGLVLIVSPLDGYGITASTGDGLLVASNANLSYRALLGFDNT